MARAGKELTAPEHYIKTPASAVSGVGSTNGCDAGCMTRGRKPVVDRRPDLAPLGGRLARAVVAGHKQDEAVPGIFRPLQRKVDRPPRAVEAVAVKIDDSVGLKGA